MFLALLRKELRQLRLWGTVAFALFSLYALSKTQWYVFFLTRFDFLRSYWPHQPYESPFIGFFDATGFSQIYGVLMIVGGITFGFTQVGGEHLRQTWQLLLHRPVSRVKIGLAKLLAGSLWYAVATLLPLLALAAYAAVPGHFAAPFRLSMLYPLLVLMLAGWAAYGAAFVVALRRARWYGSRLAPFCFVLALGLVASQHILFLLVVILLAAGLLFWATLVALCRREL